LFSDTYKTRKVPCCYNVLFFLILQVNILVNNYQLGFICLTSWLFNECTWKFCTLISFMLLAPHTSAWLPVYCS